DGPAGPIRGDGQRKRPAGAIPRAFVFEAMRPASSVAGQLAAAGDALGEGAADGFLWSHGRGHILDHVAGEAVGAVDLDVGAAVGGLADQAAVLDGAGALAELLQVGG